jgi:putative ABC transport system permease protein
MWRVSLRNLVARKLRLALSAVAIVLGVAFVAGSFIFTDSLSGAFDGIVKGGTADVEVVPRGVDEVNSVGTDARTLPASLVRRLRALPGAAAANGSDQVPGVFVISKRGKLVGGNGPPGLAFNYTDTRSITGDRILTLTRGRLPQGEGQVALDMDAAKKAGYRVGDTVTLVTPGRQPTMRATLTGLVRFGSGGGLVGATLTLFDRPTIQRLFFGGKDVYTGISLTAAPGVSQTELRDQARAVLPAGAEAVTGDRLARDTQREIDRLLGFVNTFLLVFAGVAMVVGTFLIVNTFSILVAQRSRELALLRALGASRAQVNRSVLLEALVVGAVGSTAGVAVGYLLAIGLKVLFGALGLALGGASMTLEARTVLVSYAVGVPVTMLAAYVPARRAARVPPVEAMRDDVALPESSLRRRLVGGLTLAVVGAVLMSLGLLDVVGMALSVIGAGMLAILVGVALASPVLGRPVVSVVGVVSRRLFGAVGVLATENTNRNPRRTAATASALMVGLTLVALMSILGESAKVSTDRAIDRSLTAGLVVSNATQQPFSPTYAARIRRLDGVQSVAAVRAASGLVGDRQMSVSAVDPATVGASLRVPTEAGTLSSLGGRTILVSRTTADTLGVQVGARLGVRFPAGRRDYVVGGVFTSKGAIQSNLLMTTRQLQEAGFKPEDAVVLVTRKPGVSEAQVRREIDTVLKDNPTVSLKDQKEFAAEQRGQINTVLYLVYALLGLAVVIAVLGITNTLALSVIERTHEVGLLRAIGLARRQLRLMVSLESVAISVLGAVLGVVMGVGFGIVLQRAVADDGVDVLAVPWTQLGLFVGLAVLVGMLAAVVPARRAARLNVLAAISSE